MDEFRDKVMAHVSEDLLGKESKAMKRIEWSAHT